MKNVIFDFGNVVIKWRPHRALGAFFASEADAVAGLKELGFFEWNIEQDRGRSWADGIDAIRRSNPQAVPIFEAYAAGLQAAHGERIDGTSELITELLDAGVNVCGLTNAATETVIAVKKTAPVLNKLMGVVVSGAENLVKPDAAIFDLCLKRFDFIAAETLFVDDSKENCVAAEAVGIRSHQFTSAETLTVELRELGLLQTA